MKHSICNLIHGVSLGLSVCFLMSCSQGPPAAAPSPVPSVEAPGGAGQNISEVTAGNRSGSGKISRNSIDSILNSPRRARKGLATGWGREERSRMNYTGFTRATGKPVGGVDVIHYNDLEGARAMGATPGRRGLNLQNAANGLVSWGVKGRGRSLATHHWKRGRMVVGRKNQRYSLVVKNRSRSRLEAVMSVDGLDVIDGRPASVKKRGYLVAPGKSLEVKGFRTSADAIAAFKFSSVPNSYANLRHGNTRNVGVMGLAVFTEKGIDPWGNQYADLRKRDRANPFAEAPYLRARD